MSKWIKNADTVSNTWVGKLLSVGEYYQIQSHEESTWANNDQLIIDIGSGKAVIAKDDSGSNDITSVNNAVNHLKDNLPKKVETIAIKDPGGKRARLIGTHSGNAPANSISNHDWLIPQLQYPVGTDVNSIFDGVQYYCEDSKIGDYLNFSVVDKDGTGVTLGLYSQAVYDTYKDGEGVFIVEEFGDKWYVAPNSLEDIMLYKAKLYPGLHIRVKYNNTHATNTINFFCSLFRHLDL